MNLNFNDAAHTPSTAVVVSEMLTIILLADEVSSEVLAENLAENLADFFLSFFRGNAKSAEQHCNR